MKLHPAPPSKHPSWLHKLDARAKILALLGLIVISVSTPAQAWPAFLGYFSVLCLLAIPAGLDISTLARRMALLIPLFLGLLISWPLMGTPQRQALSLNQSHSLSPALFVFNVSVKALVSLLAVTVLSASTPMHELLSGLQRLRLPTLLVLLLSFCIRYIKTLSDEAKSLHRALQARAFRGRWLWQAQVYGSLIGTLFIRSYERAERVYLAMCARGYSPQRRAAVFSQAQPWSRRDSLFLGLSGVLAGSLRWSAGF